MRSSWQLGDVLWIYLGAQVVTFAAIFGWLFISSPGQPWTTQQVLLPSVLLTPLTLLLITLFYARWRNRKLYLGRRWHDLDLLRIIGYGLVYAVAARVLSSLVLIVEQAWWPSKLVLNNPFLIDPGILHSRWALLAVVVSVVVTAPLAEELFYRGVVIAVLHSFDLGGGAVILSALFFGAAHLHLALFLPLTAAGIVLAFAYQTHYLSAVIAHALFNLVAVAGVLWN